MQTCTTLLLRHFVKLFELQNNLLIVVCCCSTSRLRLFHLYADASIADEVLKNLATCSRTDWRLASKCLNREVSLSCPICFDIHVRPRVLGSYLEGACSRVAVSDKQREIWTFVFPSLDFPRERSSYRFNIKRVFHLSE